MKEVKIMVLCGVAYLTLIAHVMCELRPTISQVSKEQIKEIGEGVEFNCTVQNMKGDPVLWIKLDKDRLGRASLSSNTDMIIRESRFSVMFDEKSSTYSLKIKNLQEADTGFYQCQILISVNDIVTADVELQIRRPPTISSNTTSHVNVTEGKPIELHCNADGYPVPRISWKRENDVLLASGGAIYRGNILTINKAHRDDRGVYFCIAENGVGAEARANASVRVEFAPVVTAVRPRVGQAQGYDVALECRVEAQPSPIVTWLRANSELRREQIVVSGDEHLDALQRYTIGQADYGEYICRAENKYGMAEAKIDLFETIIPVCSSSCG